MHISVILAAFGTGLLLSSPAAYSDEASKAPPLARTTSAGIEQVQLAPPFGRIFLCAEHSEGELAYAGDALGTDCMVTGGIEQDSETGRWNGFLKLYRSDGGTNTDWYGWNADVLSPTAGTVILALPNSEENVPGLLGTPPAATVRIRREDGIIVVIAHLQAIAVREGDVVQAGDLLGKVGNNGQSRSPHVHIGAFRESDATPFQIRWDLTAMAAAREKAGVR